MVLRPSLDHAGSQPTEQRGRPHSIPCGNVNGRKRQLMIRVGRSHRFIFPSTRDPTDEGASYFAILTEWSPAELRLGERRRKPIASDKKEADHDR
jgi:hypothetical protein